MVTLQTADNALKTFYLDAIAEQIDAKTSPFFSMIEKSTANVTGKGVTKVVRKGYTSAIAAGEETGNLPTARNGEYLTLTAPLKNIYGTIEISDKAIRSSANDEGAFVNLLNDEMQALIKAAKHNFNRMLFGDGKGKIGDVVSVSENVVQLTNIQGLEEGMYVDFRVGAGTVKYLGKKIIGVQRDTSSIVIEGVDWTGVNMDNVYVAAVGAMSSTGGHELTGLEAIFNDEPLYGVGRENAIMCPYKNTNVGDIDEEIIQKTLDMVEEQSGGKVNLIICSRGVRRALLKYYRDNNIAVSMMKIAGDVSAISFNGVPVVTDDFCPAGKMYFLNTEDFKLCQLCDWQWLEGEGGKILKQTAGKPVYSATLVKYAELICEKPCGQGLLSGITEQ